MGNNLNFIHKIIRIQNLKREEIDNGRGIGSQASMQSYVIFN